MMRRATPRAILELETTIRTVADAHTASEVRAVVRELRTLTADVGRLLGGTRMADRARASADRLERLLEEDGEGS